MLALFRANGPTIYQPRSEAWEAHSNARLRAESPINEASIYRRMLDLVGLSALETIAATGPRPLA
jgi:hypothetical protein